MVTFAHTYEPIRAATSRPFLYRRLLLVLCYNSFASSNIRHLQTANKPTPFLCPRGFVGCIMLLRNQEKILL